MSAVLDATDTKVAIVAQTNNVRVINRGGSILGASYVAFS
jgi:hypothetical protein